jgi:hypothetical protein
MGELSKALEKTEAHGGAIRLPSGGKSKNEQLTEAGVSTMPNLIDRFHQQ